MRNVFRLNTKMSALAWLFVTISSCYLLQNISSVWFDSTVFFREVSLTASSIKKWNLLPLLTYPFIHEGLMSLFLNGIALLLLGLAIERKFGARRLLYVFFTSSICGGLAWVGLHWTDKHFLAGSLAACAGLLSYFCSCNANKQATIFIFFVLPISLRPKYILIAMFSIETIGMIVGEIIGHRQMANSANFGGMIGGMLCYFLFNAESKLIKSVEKQMHKFTDKNSKTPIPMQSDSYNVYITSQSAQRSEIDRILDKINESGFESLSKEERDTLNSAKQVIRK